MVDQHHGQCHSPLMVDGYSQWEDADASGLDSIAVEESCKESRTSPHLSSSGHVAHKAACEDNGTQILSADDENIKIKTFFDDSGSKEASIDDVQSSHQTTNPAIDNLKKNPSVDGSKSNSKTSIASIDSKVSETQQSSPDLNKVVFMFQCRTPNCVAAFLNKKELLRHERTKHYKFGAFDSRNRKITFGCQWCNLCGKNCKNKDALLRHKKLYHRVKTMQRRAGHSNGNHSELNEIESCKNDDHEGTLLPKYNDVVSHGIEGAIPPKDDEMVSRIMEGAIPPKDEGVVSRNKGRKKRFVCGQCSKLCVSRAHLKRHVLIHTDSQACSLCWRVYKNMLGKLGF